MRHDPQADIQKYLKQILSRIEPPIPLDIDKFVGKDKEKQAAYLRQLIQMKNIVTSPDEIEQYASNIEQWLTSTWQLLEERHKFETEHVRTLEVSLKILNHGRMPADNLRFNICFDAGPSAFLSIPVEPKQLVKIFPIWPPAKVLPQDSSLTLLKKRGRPVGREPLQFNYIFFPEQTQKFK
jgi:hypothetical protein